MMQTIFIQSHKFFFFIVVIAIMDVEGLLPRCRYWHVKARTISSTLDVRHAKNKITCQKLRSLELSSPALLLFYDKSNPTTSSELPFPENSFLSRKEVSAERRAGILVLLSVPACWGTFEPAVKFLYSVDTGALPPLPGFIFSTIYYMVAAVTLWLAAAWEEKDSLDLDKTGLGHYTKPMDAKASTPSPVSSSVSKNQDSMNDINVSAQRDSEDQTITTAGIELGFYLFLGNAMQVIGLKTIPADRAAFLLQLTVLFVPVAQAILERDVSILTLRLGLSCVVALFGVFVLSLDGGGDSLETLLATFAAKGTTGWTLAETWASLSIGDAWIVGAAFLYTFHCIRLEGYAQQIPSAARLAASKATAETIFSGAAVVFLVAYAAMTTPQSSGVASCDGAIACFFQSSGQEIGDFVVTAPRLISTGAVPFSQLAPVLGAILWTGWIGCAYTIYAQSYGQKRVRPTVANLIYTIQPVFTAIIAWLVLGEELGPAGFLGGSMIGLAVSLVTLPSATEETS